MLEIFRTHFEHKNMEKRFRNKLLQYLLLFIKVTENLKLFQNFEFDMRKKN